MTMVNLVVGRQRLNPMPAEQAATVIKMRLMMGRMTKAERAVAMVAVGTYVLVSGWRPK